MWGWLRITQKIEEAAGIRGGCNCLRHRRPGFVFDHGRFASGRRCCRAASREGIFDAGRRDLGRGVSRDRLVGGRACTLSRFPKGLLTFRQRRRRGRALGRRPVTERQPTVQRRLDFARRLKSVGRVFGHEPLANRHQGAGGIRSKFQNAARRLSGVRRVAVFVRALREWALPCKQEVHDATQRIQVTAGVGSPLAEVLLRREIVGESRGFTVDHHLVGRFRIDQPMYAQVQEFHIVLAVDHAVAGPYITVEHVPLMGIGQTGRGLTEISRHLLAGEGSLGVHQLLQVAAGDILHDQEIPLVLTVDVIDMDDVAMVQAGQILGVLQKLLQHVGVGICIVARQCLDDHLPAQLHMFRNEHTTRAIHVDLVQEFVLPERQGEPSQQQLLDLPPAQHVVFEQLARDRLGIRLGAVAVAQLAGALAGQQPTFFDRFPELTRRGDNHWLTHAWIDSRPVGHRANELDALGPDSRTGNHLWQARIANPDDFCSDMGRDIPHAVEDGTSSFNRTP